MPLSIRPGKATFRRPTKVKTTVPKLLPASDYAGAPTAPPPGSYDPAIDAQTGQANRGLADYLIDYTKNWGEPGTALGGRVGEDYKTASGRLTKASGNARGDIERQSGRSLTDLLLSRARGQEDYGTNVAGLNRQYERLGQGQAQTAQARGVAGGGAILQSAAKRATNQGIDRAQLDTSLNRFMQDSQSAEQRLGEDKQLGLGRLTDAFEDDRSDLNRDYLRGGEDSATALARAQRENAQFLLDAGAQRFYQANMPLPSGRPPAPKKTTTKRRPKSKGSGR